MEASMRTIQCAALAFVTGWVVSMAPSQANEADNTQSAARPLEVLADCFEAVQNGEFERYVDHLTFDEQRIQAGYVLFITSALSHTTDAADADPRLVLLGKALRDVARRHAGRAANSEAGQLARSLANQSAPVVNLQVDPLPAEFPRANASATMTRDACIRASAALADPREFLIAALAEVSRPTSVSGAEPSDSEPLPSLADLVGPFPDLSWTLYTRGDYAIAVVRAPKVEGPEDNAPQIPSSPKDDPPMRVEFRKADGQWKVDRLLPVHTMLPGIRVEPAPIASSYPAPIVSPYRPPSTHSRPPAQGPNSP
jgi:hypothetical protein